MAYFASEKVCFKFVSWDPTMLKIKIFVLPLQMEKQNSKVGHLKQN